MIGRSIMEKIKPSRNSEEESVLASLKIHAYIALNGMALPSLRCVGINWDSSQTDGKLVFFHDGLVDEPEEWHYGCIETEATSMRHPLYQGEQIMMHLEVISCPYPMQLPEVSEVVYLRREPNTKFNDVDMYVPSWIVDSVIRLKVNEALRGKVTPELREIHLTWDETNTKALITFIHDGAITKETSEHYQEIFEIATATSKEWKRDVKAVIPQLDIKAVPHPEKIEKPKNLDRLYSRKEPFTDKPIGEG